MLGKLLNYKLLPILTLVLVTIKLTNTINISWFLVMLPTLIPLFLILTISLLAGSIMLFTWVLNIIDRLMSWLKK